MEPFVNLTNNAQLNNNLFILSIMLVTILLYELTIRRSLFPRQRDIEKGLELINKDTQNELKEAKILIQRLREAINDSTDARKMGELRLKLRHEKSQNKVLSKYLNDLEDAYVHTISINEHNSVVVEFKERLKQKTNSISIKNKLIRNYKKALVSLGYSMHGKTGKLNPLTSVQQRRKAKA